VSLVSNTTRLPINQLEQANWVAQAETFAARSNPNSSSNLSGILKPGSRGEEVKAVQVLLQQLGYEVTTDGRYGKKTQDAVADFQQRQGLPVDGRVGAKTWEQLQKAQSELPGSASTSALESESEPTSSLSANPSEADSSEVSATSRSPEIPPTVSPTRPNHGAASASPLPKPDSSNVFGLIWWQWILALAVLSLAIALGTTLIRQAQKTPATPQELENSGLHSGFPTHLLQPERSQPDLGTANQTTDRPTHNNGAGAVSPKLLPEPLGEIQTNQPQDAQLSAVRRLPKAHVGEELIKDLSNPDPHKRRQAIWELGQQGDSTAIKPLVDLMIDSDSQQRSLILTAVSEIAIRTLKPISRALLISLQDDSPEVRKNAIRDVTRIYDLMAQINQLLPHALDDRDVEVQETAQWAINQLNRLRPPTEAESLFNSPYSPPPEQPSEPPFF
jgi:peptidoglycan hydrolase-like protein with peptidoglycan-binding domain